MRCADWKEILEVYKHTLRNKKAPPNPKGKPESVSVMKMMEEEWNEEDVRGVNGGAITSSLGDDQDDDGSER